ncbi:hypothetical protein [Cellulomonas denverensis]|uniref:hypothetical protein n=1 Tax=Cellulomonas denverensis TaxID=264297 RepID=UPI0035EDA965
MTSSARPTLDAIARPSGALAMVAMDQRESLRTMFDQAGACRVPDETMIAFKLDVARALSPLASGFLIDHVYGVDAAAALLPPSCGLILAADDLEQEPGGPVQETGLDQAVVAPDGDLHGAVAIKLLVIWRRDERRAQRVELAREFIRTAAERGVLSVLEPVVRATEAELAAGTWNQEEAIIEAARELSPIGPDLYKVQVPLGGRAPAAELERECARLGEAITGPWVVLSQGVQPEDFLGAVRAACRGGASGFLAGRALWSDVVGLPDVPAALAEVSVPRLQRLVDVVDAEARPWTAA